jgi:hypothetical protein
MGKLYEVDFIAVSRGRCMVYADSEEEAMEIADWREVDAWENPHSAEAEGATCIGEEDE